MGISSYASVLLVAVCLAGCSHTRPNVSPETPPITIDSKDILFVAMPSVSDSVDTLMGRTGWGEGRFSRELHKEILFQFNRDGVATVEDSAQAKSALRVFVTGYVHGSGTASRFEGNARLTTGAGERVIEFKKASERGEAPERQDPTVDNLRKIAATLVKAARKDPHAKKKVPKFEYVPDMMTIF